MKVPKDGTFCYSFKSDGKEMVGFEHSIPVPLEIESVDNMFLMLCSVHNVPCYAKEDLRDSLTAWIHSSTAAFYDKEGSKAIAALLSQPDAAAAFAEAGRAYHAHQLVLSARPHPESLETTWTALAESGEDLARYYAKEARLQARLGRLLRERHWELDRLQRKHSEVISKAVEHLETDESGKASTHAASRHFAHLNRVEENYEEQIRTLKDSQRRELRSFAAQLQEARVQERTLPLEEEESKAQANSHHQSPPSNPQADVGPTLDESYTIYLGAQEKRMQNLRLMAVEPVSAFCRLPEDSNLRQSARLQLAFSLYGVNDLSAVVLLVQAKAHYHQSFRTPFYRAVEESVEVHFSPLEEQLDEIARIIKERNGGEDGALSPGDVYVTRHSNLASVQLVFHLVVDDALVAKEINSRHPCISGLRNIIRQCGRFGVGKLALPLLLVDSLGEEHTMQWCGKRAELIQKCVKGFVMEGAGTGTAFTLSFLLPPQTQPPLFAALAQMLPLFFHLVPTKTN